MIGEVSGRTAEQAKNPVYERWRWQIFAVTWLAYAGFNLTRMSFPAAKAGIQKDPHFALNPSQMAWVDGAFLAAYAVGQLFAGVAGDRFGPRKVVLAGMLGSAAVSATMAGCSAFGPFAWMFLLQGLFQSAGWAPLVKNVGNFFSLRERGVVLGLWCTNYPIGSLVATIFASFIAEHLGWRFAFYLPAICLLAICALFAVFQKNRPEDAGLASIESYHREEGTEVEDGLGAKSHWTVIRETAANRMVLLLGLVYFCLKPARYAILFWGPKYIYDRLGTSMTEAGVLSAMFEMAGPISILASGWVSDRIFQSRRMPVSVLCLVCLGCLLLVLHHLPATAFALGAALFGLGFFAYAPDAMIAGVAVVDFGTKQGASTASGLVNCLGSLGALAGGMLPGLVQAELGWERIFIFLAAPAFFAALLLLPQWKALPKGRQTERMPGKSLSQQL